MQDLCQTVRGKNSFPQVIQFLGLGMYGFFSVVFDCLFIWLIYNGYNIGSILYNLIYMKNHFFFGYAGNKRNEVENIFEEIKDNLENKKTVVECYCGSSAFSYYLSTKYPKIFKYVLNDNDKYLIELYETARDEEKLNKLIDDINILMEDIDKVKYNEIIKKNDLVGYVIKNSYYSIRAGLFPTNKIINKNYNKFNLCPIIDFIRNEDIEFYSIDAIDIYDKYKNDENSIIFLDPPYLNSENCFYKNPKLNIYEKISIDSINKYPSYIVLCLEYTWIIKLLFKGHKFITYEKTYELTKKKTTHCIITNR
jgi:site-specific DNA-adenine methylase